MATCTDTRKHNKLVRDESSSSPGYPTSLLLTNKCHTSVLGSPSHQPCHSFLNIGMNETESGSTRDIRPVIAPKYRKLIGQNDSVRYKYDYRHNCKKIELAMVRAGRGESLRSEYTPT